MQNEEVKSEKPTKVQPDIVDRTFRFSVAIVKFCRELNKIAGAHRTIGGQLLRSGTSIGANVQEAQAGQSRADFIAKRSIAQREARESLYWLRLIVAADLLPAEKADTLIKEADELTRIISAIVASCRCNTPQ